MIGGRIRHMSQEIRWHYRFDNFSRAHSLLRDALEDGVEPLSQLEREGVIQRFEYTFELSWKLLKDKMDHDGVKLLSGTPREVIRQAFRSELIEDGDAWMAMLTDRNRMSHTYDFEKFEEVISDIRSRYLAILDDLYQRLLPEVT